MELTRVFVSPGKDGTDTPLTALLRDTHGNVAYQLECHNGEFEGQSLMNFSGDFQCGLFAGKGKGVASGNLLASEDRNERSSDWWNRGRMRSAQLRGDCLEFPEYGTVRHFTLRGMILTLSFTEIQWSKETDSNGMARLGGFRVTISVVPDENSASARADPVAGPKPPMHCYP
jgi:hypothetical protein